MLQRPSEQDCSFVISFRRTPHPVTVTIKDNRDHIRVLVYSYYTTITGWGVLLRYPGDYGHSAMLCFVSGNLYCHPKEGPVKGARALHA